MAERSAAATLSQRKQMADHLMQVFEAQNEALIIRVLKGQMSVADWQIEMRERLRRQNMLMLIAGAGGNKADVRADDWLKLGSELKSQYKYLEGFARDLADGTPGALSHAVGRAKMYARSTRASFWRQASPVDLPAYPGDGSSECLTNCLCEWDLEYETDAEGNVTAVLATWSMSDDPEVVHCDTCPERAREWNPLRIPVPKHEHYDVNYKAVA